MKKLLTRFSLFVILLFAFSVFSWIARHATLGDKTFGETTTKGLLSFVGFLDLFEKSVEEVKTLASTFISTPEDFTTINKLQANVNVLISYTNLENSRTVELRNLRNDSVLHQWEIDNPFAEHDRIKDPLLLPNKSLCYSFNG